MRLAIVPKLEAELDRLYGLPLEEFTAARNELSDRLRKAGQGDVADRVRELRKPSVPVWAVNQLARRHPREVERLVAAGASLREAQGAALRGQGSDAVRDSTAAERAAVRKLTRLAEKVMAENGRRASRPVLERILALLRMASVDSEAAELLTAGRLEDELESSGFSAVASLAPPAPRRGAAPKRGDEKRRRDQHLRKLRARAERLERSAAEAEAVVTKAEQAADAARERAERARAEAAAAAEELAAAERPE